MAIKDIFKVSRKTFFDPSAWLGYPRIKSSFQASWDLMKGLFIVPKAKRKETFAQALTRFKLTPKETKKLATEYFSYAIFFVVLSAATVIYSFYLLIVPHTFSGCLLGIAVSVLLLSQAFRYHFWYFQIKHQKLGCTFDEWLEKTFGIKREPKS
jgi:intracellular multiplication protein IcmV